MFVEIIPYSKENLIECIYKKMWKKSIFISDIELRLWTTYRKKLSHSFNKKICNKIIKERKDIVLHYWVDLNLPLKRQSIRCIYYISSFI